jgi:hypothetical protein
VSYLENAGAGDRHLYEGIATIGGVVVDAIVTLVGASASSVGFEDFEDFTSGSLPSEALTVPGCYSNVAFRAAYLADTDYNPTGFSADDLLTGQRAAFVDQYDEDPAYNSTINSGMGVCPNADDEENGDITIRVDFQVAGNPVTLTNVALHITDLDNQQTMELSSPKPSSWIIDGASLVTVSEATSGVLTLVGYVDPSPYEEPYYPERYTAEAHYDSVSSLTYTFNIVDAGHGSVQVAFDSYFPSAASDNELADTGVETMPVGASALGALFLGALALGGAVVMARRARRNRV